MWSPTTLRRTLFLIAAALLALRALAQVNAYAEVTAIMGTTLTLSGAVETYDTFEDGEQAIIMQMQDDAAGSNLNNTINFGDLATITSAGVWEVVTISSHAEVAGTPTSAVVSPSLVHIFHFGVKCRVQLISFPQLGSPHFITTEPITALPWNGVYGGVVAFQVAGILDLAHDVSANYAGFRGGVPSTNFLGTCASTMYTSNLANYAEKGEGIQRVSSINYRYGRGKFLNGGGGGNPKNAGGGGGGHWTAGGGGGGGYGCSPGAGGLGGRGFGNYVYYDRLFMGGGGGGGQQNNTAGGAGGAGGGFVLVRASTLRTIGPCPTLFVSANGANGGSSIATIPDGAGGGGAGGSVLIQVNNFMIDPSCDLIFQANGGNGGQVICTAPTTSPPPGNWVDYGGGGGGGSQGVVMCMGFGSGMQGMSSPGQGGMHNSMGGRASDAPGPANGGVQGFGVPIALPVELLYFKASMQAGAVLLEWATGSERNCERFILERSADIDQWNEVGSIAGAVNSVVVRTYQFKDTQPLSATSYYRLAQIDLDGTRNMHGPVAVTNEARDVTFAPQPADDLLRITGPDLEGASYSVLSMDGRMMRDGTISTAAGQAIDVASLSPGAYILRLTNSERTLFQGTIVIAR